VATLGEISTHWRQLDGKLRELPGSRPAT